MKHLLKHDRNVHFTVPSTTEPSDPMILDASFKTPQPRGPLTTEERQRRIQYGLCLYCGEKGHLARNCPLLSSRSQNSPRPMFTFQNSDSSSYLLLPVRIPLTENRENREKCANLIALVDSGSFTNCADKTTLHQMGIPILDKLKQISAETIDGRKITITQETPPVSLMIDGYHQEIQFDVITSPHYPIILGAPWLKKYNPRVDWKKMQICPQRDVIFTVTDSPTNQVQMMNQSDQKIGKCSTSEITQELEKYSPFCSPKISEISQKLDLWHHRLGHRNLRDIETMANHQLCESLSIIPDAKERMTYFCETCVTCKAKNKTFSKQGKARTWELLERLDFDECGPLPVASINGERYFITFCERKSKAKFTYLLHSKNQALDKFKSLKTLLENKTEKKSNLFLVTMLVNLPAMNS